MAKRKTKRRKLRFGLISIFVLTTIVGIVFGRWVYIAQTERKAEQFVETLNGHLVFRHQAIKPDGSMPYGYSNPAKPTPGNRFWQETLGEHYFRRIDSVHFDNPHGRLLTNQEVAELADRFQNCHSLRTLSLDAMNVKFDGLMPIGQLKQVERLTLSRVRVGDIHTRFLKNMTSLRTLYLHNTRASGKFVSYLESAKRLNDLHLSGENFQAKDLVGIQKLEQVQSLILYSKNLDSAVLQHVAKMPKLNWLNLYLEKLQHEDLKYLVQTKLESFTCRGVTDDFFRYASQIQSLKDLSVVPEHGQMNGSGLKHLNGHPNLQQIAIHYGFNPNDNCLRHLQAIPNLKYLEFAGPVSKENLEHLKRLKDLKFIEIGLTQQQQAELQRALPACQIWNP